MWTNARITIYAGFLLAAGAAWAKAAGVADYDAATGMVDFKPMNINIIAGMLGTSLGTALASVAAWFRWGRK
jgi:hypothetical protein